MSILIRSTAAALLLPLALAGCIDEGPTNPAAQRAVFSILGGLAPGESVLLEGEDASTVFLPGGADGAEYLIVPFFASDNGLAQLRVELEGVNLGGAGASSSLQPLDPSRPLLTVAGAPPARGEDPFHHRLREWEVREAPRRLRSPAWPSARLRASRLAAFRAQDVPQVGEILDLRTLNPESSNLCENPLSRPGRVAAVTQRAILVVDTLNPTGGAAAEDLTEIAREFDQLVYPVNAANFGSPTDVDANERVIIFITSVVNQLTPPGSDSYVTGFFFGGDLFPASRNSPVFGEVPEGFVCPASNEAEIFYILAPDPTGEINGNERPTEDVLLTATAVIGHELQHLINLGRRLYVNNAQVAEEIWLNEGLSHLAEELLFYEAARLQPRRNLGERQLLQSQQIIDALLRFQWSNIGLLYSYLIDPSRESLLGIDDLPTRGAAWAFLRYAADQESGPDDAFFFQLVNSTTNGVENLNEVLEEYDAIDLMQGWTASVFTDDYPQFNPSGPSDPALLEQPSWNFRSIFGLVLEEYPLETERITDGGEVALTLQGGGAAFVTATIGASAQARITTTSAGAIPPTRLRLTVVRLR